MKTNQLHILLADDDEDDCFLFREALEDVAIKVKLSTVKDGVELLHWLSQKINLPNVLFLDLNMPRKNGLECLAEIKKNPHLQSLPVIIFSTSANPASIDYLYEKGAHYFIQKPGNFKKLTQLIEQVLRLPEEKKWVQPSRKDFVLFSVN